VAALDAQARRVETPCGDGMMVWRIWGAGPAVVLLHGGHGAWSHWIRNIPTLSQRFMLIVPDMPGFAESASPPSPYTADSMAAILATGLERVLDRHKLSIVGFSFGGVIGGTLAKHIPERVERVVLVGSGGLALPRPKLGEMKNWRRMDKPEDRLEAHRHNLATLMLKDPANIDALAMYLQSNNTVRTRINSRAISMTDALRRSLSEFDAPLAGIWATHDATVMEFLDTREELLRSLDGAAEFVRIPGGHWIQYEAPQAFDAAVTKILETKRAGRGKPA
jgi:pimeloyl-ACP methyl ester carboxylesterase